MAEASDQTDCASQAACVAANPTGTDDAGADPALQSFLRTISRLEATVKEIKQARRVALQEEFGAGHDGTPDELPVVLVNGRQLREVVGELWEALDWWTEESGLFRRGQSVVRIVSMANGPATEPLTPTAFVDVLMRACAGHQITRTCMPSRPPPSHASCSSVRTRAFGGCVASSCRRSLGVAASSSRRPATMNWV